MVIWQPVLPKGMGYKGTSVGRDTYELTSLTEITLQPVCPRELASETPRKNWLSDIIITVYRSRSDINM